MNREDVLALLARRTALINSRDLATFGELYADRAELESPLAGSVVGRDAIIRASNAFFAAFPDATVQDETTVVDGNHAAIIAELSGTHTGDILGLPPNGRPIRLKMAFFITIEHGRIVRERRVYDFTGMLVQIGVLKAKPA